MKTNIRLTEQCFQAFLNQHPELTVNSQNILTQMMSSEKAIYSKLAIHFAISFMKDESALASKSYVDMNSDKLNT